jgi:hypothetical protein
MWDIYELGGCEARQCGLITSSRLDKPYTLMVRHRWKNPEAYREFDLRACVVDDVIQWLREVHVYEDS